MRTFLSDLHAAYLVTRRPIIDMMLLLIVCLLGWLLVIVSTNYDVGVAVGTVVLDTNEKTRSLVEIHSRRCGI